MITGLIRNCIDSRGYDLVRKSFWPDAPKLLEDQPNPVIIDVGANEGQSLREIKTFIPDASVCCLEPDPDAYDRLVSLASRTPKARAFQLAAGARPETLVLNRNRHSVTNSFLSPSSDIADGKWLEMMSPLDKVEVEVVEISAFCKQHGISHVSVLKTDCQGYDLEVLKGVGSMWDQRRVNVVCCEVLFTKLYDQQAYFDEIIRFLRDREYELYGLYGVARTNRKSMAWADAVFCRRDWLAKRNGGRS